MSPHPRQQIPDPLLRQKAEAAVTAKPTDVTAMSVEEIHRMVHELEVHEIELQMQNDHLLNTQAELAKALQHFNGLFDFAPIGYVILDQDGVVREANLTLARMLGMDRNELIEHNFASFVTRDSQDALYLHLLALKDRPDKHDCDLYLSCKNAEVLEVRMESIAQHDVQVPRLLCALIDVTERNRAERALMAANADLIAKNEELERFNRAGVSRELRMIELKKEINDLCAATNQRPRYPERSDDSPPL